jgi:hypothetical protein
MTYNTPEFVEVGVVTNVVLGLETSGQLDNDVVKGSGSAIYFVEELMGLDD